MFYQDHVQRSLVFFLSIKIVLNIEPMADVCYVCMNVCMYDVAVFLQSHFLSSELNQP